MQSWEESVLNSGGLCYLAKPCNDCPFPKSTTATSKVGSGCMLAAYTSKFSPFHKQITTPSKLMEYAWGAKRCLWLYIHLFCSARILRASLISQQFNNMIPCRSSLFCSYNSSWMRENMTGHKNLFAGNIHMPV